VNTPLPVSCQLAFHEVKVNHARAGNSIIRRPSHRRVGLDESLDPIQVRPGEVGPTQVRVAEAARLTEILGSDRRLPQPEIVHVASAVSTAPDGVAPRWRKHHR
jgi:hypothetical protein